jgi:tetratricopeptide (TPR) repeat protein
MERQLQRRAAGDVMKLKLGAACFSPLLLAAAASLVAAQAINPEVAGLNKIAGERLDAHDWDSAERHYLRALDIAANSEAGPTVAVLRQNLGNLYATESRYADAEKQYWLSYDLLKAQYGAQDLRVAPVLNKIAELTCLGGHFAAANSLFQRSLDILQSQKSPNDAEIATVLADVASTEWLLGNLSKAEKTLTGLTALFERGGKDQQANLAFVLEIRTKIAEQKGNLPEAETHCERALLILEQSGGPQDLATGLVTMGDLLLRRQDLQGAQAKLERALHLITSDAAEESPLWRCFDVRSRALLSHARKASRSGAVIRTCDWNRSAHARAGPPNPPLYNADLCPVSPRNKTKEGGQKTRSLRSQSLGPDQTSQSGEQRSRYSGAIS